MVLVYYGVSLNNQLINPLEEKLVFCSPKELANTKISHDEFCGLLRDLKAKEYIKEATLVSTCNRFEVITDIEEGSLNKRNLIEVEAIIKDATKSEISFPHLVDSEAKLQFFRTYCGLNSGLVGEDEICAQIDTSFRQAASMGFIKNSGINLLETAIKIRALLDDNVYKQKVSYCEISLTRSLEKLKIDTEDINKLEKVIVFGSGNTTKQSCLALVKLGLDPEKITVIHRISSSSEQVKKIRSCPGLDSVNFARSKDNYRTTKVKELSEEADLLIFGIDTKTPVLELEASSQKKVIDFNSNPSCTFAPGYDESHYISTLEADSYVREYSQEQVNDPTFLRRIKIAEDFINKFIEGYYDVSEITSTADLTESPTHPLHMHIGSLA